MYFVHSFVLKIKIWKKETVSCSIPYTKCIENPCCSCLVTKLRLTLCDPMDCARQAPLSMGFSRQEITGVGCHFLLQSIFPTQGLNPCLLHWQVDSLSLSHQENRSLCGGGLVAKLCPTPGPLKVKSLSRV